MCIKPPSNSAAKKQVALQERQALVAAEGEDDARGAAKADTLTRRRAERRGRSVQSLAILGAAPAAGMRSLFDPTGASA